MANDQVIENVVEEPIEAVLLAIPEDQIDRALAALEAIESSAEVAGFAYGRPTMASASISGTGCSITGFNSDFNCKDSDSKYS